MTSMFTFFHTSHEMTTNIYRAFETGGSFDSGCYIQGEIGFQKLQNFWVAEALMSSYIFWKMFSFKLALSAQ